MLSKLLCCSRVLKVLIRRPYNMTDGKSIGTTPLFRYPLADLPGLIIAVHVRIFFFCNKTSFE